VALPALVYILLGTTTFELPPFTLVNAFVDILSSHETSIIKSARYKRREFRGVKRFSYFNFELIWMQSDSNSSKLAITAYSNC